MGHTACPLAGHGIVARYGLPGVRDQVRAILANKRAAGYLWLRVLLWWTSDPIGDVASSWGVVPSGLPEPYTSNLRNYLSDARDAGFRLELAAGPSGTNNPTLQSFVPALTDVNWQTIVAMHAIGESVAASTTYDLGNETAPHPYWGEAFLAQASTYIRTLWTRATGSWPLAELTVSFHSGRWQWLLPALDPDPSWYEVHVYGEGAPYDVPPDSKPVTVGEHYADVPAPTNSRVNAEAYWPLASTPDADGDANCTAAYTP